VLILTRDEAIGHPHDVIAVPTTRTSRGLKTEVEIGPDDWRAGPERRTPRRSRGVRESFLSQMRRACEAERQAPPQQRLGAAIDALLDFPRRRDHRHSAQADRLSAAQSSMRFNSRP
jgi:hypothetical protein